MEQSWCAIVKAFTVPDSLGHGLAHIQTLYPFDLDMYPGQTGQVWNLAIGQRTAPLDIIAPLPEDSGQLPLTVCAFAL